MMTMFRTPLGMFAAISANALGDPARRAPPNGERHTAVLLASGGTVALRKRAP